MHLGRILPHYDTSIALLTTVQSSQQMVLVVAEVHSDHYPMQLRMHVHGDDLHSIHSPCTCTIFTA